MYPNSFEARSLLPALEGEQWQGRDAVFAEHSRDGLLPTDYMTMVRTNEWKLVHFLQEPFGQLFDLACDSQRDQQSVGRPRPRRHKARAAPEAAVVAHPERTDHQRLGPKLPLNGDYDADHRRTHHIRRPIPLRRSRHRRRRHRSGRVRRLGISGGLRSRSRHLQTLSDRPGPAPHRAPLAIPLPLEPLPRLRRHGRPQRHRHRPLGHRRQTFWRARLPAARRQGARQGARLLPRFR